MPSIWLSSVAVLPLCLLLTAHPLCAQQREEAAVQSATAVLGEIMSVPMSQIPRTLLADAQGIAIIPNVLKGGFIIGVRHGNGVLLVRDENGAWHTPVFISLTGGNIGWQAGVQATDLILVFKTQKSVQGILSGKLTIGADAAAAAGPVGRQAAAATDAKLKAEIYSYSRSRGLFAGVSIDGSAMTVDQLANAAYYGNPAPGQPPVVPPSAIKLVQVVAAYSQTQVAPPQTSTAVPLRPTLAEPRAETETDRLRNELARTAPALYELVDSQWQIYLALPAEVFSPNAHPSLAALNTSLARFDTVASDPQYRALAERPQFQSTYDLLRRYVAARSKTARLQNNRPLQLPAPPLR